GPKPWAVDVYDDPRYDRAEPVVLALQQPQGNPPIGAPGSTTLTIANDETPGRVEFTSEIYSVDAAHAMAYVAVRHVTGSAWGQTVLVTLSDGSAQAGGDYVNPGPVTLTFLTGNDFEIVSIPLIHNGPANKYLNLELSSPSLGLSLGSPTRAVLWLLE